ncbi:DUF4292 domain-containing protein [Sphingobacterium sp. T2]|uniref:DUF4292 domain-containing protein n=1 Tax=Sphingobacterium sp. T2 TaxID=1590596 RepID=UPI000B0D459E|nr:DUF4292 domain-containing protein [Sphingobacterium sp. T2]
MPNITTSPSSENVVSGIVINNLDFHTFSGRAKAAVEFGKERQDATLNVRINRSKAIWISVTASFLNIEAVRVLITPDSIKIMNSFKVNISSNHFPIYIAIQERALHSIFCRICLCRM